MNKPEQLNIGDIVEVNAEVPVMPRLKLSQVKRGDAVRRLKPRHRFKIIGKSKNGRVWYKVATEYRGTRLHGWVNSVCLVGKQVEISKDSNGIGDDESRRKERIIADVCTIIIIIVVTAGTCWNVWRGM